VIASGIIVKSYTVTGLITGKTYRFRIEARNSIGYSNHSNVVQAIAAVAPSAPAAPSTVRDINDIYIDWSSPSTTSAATYGAEILGYKVFIRWQDGTYTEEKTHCDGSSAVIIANTQCVIPITVLIASPYSLLQGSSIYASVVAYNAVGDSPNSDVGNGALVIVSRVPDAPINLMRDVMVTLDKTKISFKWEDSFDGNQPVLDYRVSYDQGKGLFVVSDSGFKVKSFTQAGLTPGVTYGFKIEARNVVGYSLFSTELRLVAAEEPATPLTPTTSINEVANTITISW